VDRQQGVARSALGRSAGTGTDPVAIGVVSVMSREVKSSKFIAPTGAPGGLSRVALDSISAAVKVQGT